MVTNKKECVARRKESCFIVRFVQRRYHKYAWAVWFLGKKGLVFRNFFLDGCVCIINSLSSYIMFINLYLLTHTHIFSVHSANRLLIVAGVRWDLHTLSNPTSCGWQKRLTSLPLNPTWEVTLANSPIPYRIVSASKNSWWKLCSIWISGVCTMWWTHLLRSALMFLLGPSPVKGLKPWISVCAGLILALHLIKIWCVTQKYSERGMTKLKF